MLAALVSLWISAAPEVALGGGPRVGVGEGARVRQSIAAYDGGYLLTWFDSRVSGLYKVYAARLTPGGSALDDAGIPVSLEPLNQLEPVVACGPTSCLIIWSADVSTLQLGAQHFELMGRRVDFDGRVLDPAPLVLGAGNTGLADDPELTCDGTRYLAIWEDTPGLRTRVIGLDGVPLGPVNLLAGTGNASTPRVIPFAGNFLAAWETGPIRVAQLGLNGGVIGFIDLRAGEEPRLAAGLGQAAVIWEETDGGERALWGTRFNTFGIPVDPQPTRLFTSPGNAGIAHALGWNGFVYVTVAGATRPLRVNWLTTGNPQDGGSPGFSATGDYELVLSSNGGAFSAGTLVQTVDVNAALLPPQVGLGVALPSDITPHLAFDGAHVLVTWADHTTAQTVAQRLLAPDGTPVRPAADLGFSGASDEGAVIAFDGVGFTTVWYRTIGVPEHIFAAQLDLDGGLSTPFDLALPAIGLDSDVDLALGGGVALAVWTTHPTPTTSQIAAVRFADGGTLDPLSRVPFPRAITQELPAVAFGAGEFLVVWSNGTSDIHGGRIALDGTALDTDDGGLLLGRRLSVVGAPAVAGSDAGFLVVWGGTLSTPRLHDTTSAVRVDGNGTVLDVPPLELGLNGPVVYTMPARPAVVFDGLQYQVAFEVVRDAGVEIAMRSVQLDGGVGPIYFMSSSRWEDQRPALVVTGPGGGLLAFQHFDEVAGARRIFAVPWGTLFDAGVAPFDAGTEPDAGVEPPDAGVTPSLRELNVRCGCSSAPAALLIALLATLRMRDRRGHM